MQKKIFSKKKLPLKKQKSYISRFNNKNVFLQK